MDDSTKKEQSLTLQCPTCAARYLMPPWQEGQKYGCKKCGASLLFGKFALLAELGRGGFGVVYKAWQADLQRVVALKFLHADTEEAVERFLREARIAANLSHPNITAIYEVGRHEGKPYITMQFVDGQTTNKVHMTPREAAQVVRDAALAVDYAHAREIIHRDIKPHNIMMTAERSGTSAAETVRRVFVMDFGLARSSKGDSSLTAEGQVMGTPAFMSPEQAEGRALDFKSDVYSLGATLWSLATRRAPFEAATPVQVLMKVTRGDILAPSKVNPDVDANLESIILKAMAKDPGQRYPTAAALAADLARWLQGDVPDSGATVQLSSRSVSASTSPASGKKAGFAIAAAVAVAVAAAGAGAVLFMNQGKPPGPPPAKEEDYVAVKIESTPSNCLVKAEGVEKTWTTPATIKASELKGTTVTFTFSKPGYQATTRSATYARGQPDYVLASLDPVTVVESNPPPAAPKILLKASATPAGAKLRLAGREYGLPIELSDREIPAGEYPIEIVLDGYTPHAEKLLLTPERVATLSATLVKSASEPAFTLVSVPAGARVLLNDKDTGRVTPCVILREQIKGPSVQVELQLDGYVSRTEAVEIRAASYEVKVELTPQAGFFTLTAAQPRAQIHLVSVPPGAKSPKTIVQLWSENPEAVAAALAALDPADAALAAPRLKELGKPAPAGAERAAKLEMSTFADGAGNAAFQKVPVAKRYHVLATSAGSRDFLSEELAVFPNRETVVRVEMAKLVTLSADIRPPLGHFDVVLDGKPAGRLDAAKKSLRVTAGVVVLKYVPPAGDPLLCAFSATKSVTDKLELGGNIYRLCGQAFESDRDVLPAIRSYTKALQDNAVPAAERAELDALPDKIRSLYRAWIEALPRKAFGEEAERRLRELQKAEEVAASLPEIYAASDGSASTRGRAAAALAAANAKLGRPYEAAEWLDRAAREGVDPGGEVQGATAAAGRAYPGLAERARDVARALDAVRAAKVKKPAFLGARGVEVPGRGTRVEEIAKGSPAEAALKFGDLITGVGEAATPTPGALDAALAAAGAGAEVEILLERGGEKLAAKLTLAPAPARAPEWVKPPPRVGVLQLVSDQYGIFLKLDEGAAVQPGDALEVVRGGEAIGELTAFKAIKADETYKFGGLECRRVRGEFKKGDEVRRR